MIKSIKQKLVRLCGIKRAKDSIIFNFNLCLRGHTKHFFIHETGYLKIEIPHTCFIESGR